MHLEIEEWRGDAFLRIPSEVLDLVGLVPGDVVDVRREAGKLVLQRATLSLEDMLSRVTPENQHGVVWDDPSSGAETW